MTENPDVAVITSNRRIQRHVTRALAAARWSVESLPFQKGAIDASLETKRGLYVIDGNHEADQVQSMLAEIAKKQPTAQAVVLQHESDRMLLDLFANAKLNNCVGRHGDINAAQDMIDEDELIVTCRKMANNDIFGLDKYMSTWGMELTKLKIRSSEDKFEAIDQLESFLTRIDCYPAIVPPIALVGEELVMNALYNAPRDSSGNPKYKKDQRQSHCVTEDEAVTFTFACNGCYVGLSVEDQSGTLDRDSLVRSLEFCYRRTEGFDTDLQSGLGLYMVFNSITQLVFNLQAGKRTEVIALFYVRSGARSFKSSGRSLNIFVAQ